MVADKINEDKVNMLFLNLVLTFQTAAMQQMGKLKNPVSEKIERNLPQAELSIDMLDMIKAKTEGNLSETEDDLLSKVISELKMNFIDEREKDEKADVEKDKEEGTPEKAETETGDDGEPEPETEEQTPGDESSTDATEPLEGSVEKETSDKKEHEDEAAQDEGESAPESKDDK